MSLGLVIDSQRQHADKIPRFARLQKTFIKTSNTKTRTSSSISATIFT